MPTETTTNSLQRWCLRALHQSCETMQHNATRATKAVDPATYSVNYQRQPPLNYSCIAPHCEEWSNEGDCRGFCRYEQQHAGQWPSSADALPGASPKNQPA